MARAYRIKLQLEIVDPEKPENGVTRVDEVELKTVEMTAAGLKTWHRLVRICQSLLALDYPAVRREVEDEEETK